MRRIVLLLASVALAVVLASGVALAEEKLDQENADPPHSWLSYEEFNSHEQHLAQVVTAGKTGRLSKVSVRIERAGCFAGEADSLYKDINVRIYRIGQYHYDWPLSASTTIPASQVPYRRCTSWAVPQWTDATFDLDNRPWVNAGNKYAIALEPEPVSSGSSASPNYHWYYNAAYLGGDGYYHLPYFPGHDWSQIGALDFLFRAYVDVPDTDGDGLANDVDQCDTEPGPESNNGCPVPPDTVSPTGSVSINGGARKTRSRAVALTLDATDPSPGMGIVSMRIKNAGGN